ncbi:hypothetical protein ACLKA6_019961 [Drosophila palustris]
MGNVKLQTESGDLTLENVLHVPDMKGNFISVAQAIDRGCTVVFDRKFAVFRRNGQDLLKAHKSNKLFVFKGKRNFCYGAAQQNADVWHNSAANTSFSDLANKTTVEDVIKIVPNFKESKQQSDECSENGILSEEYASAEEEDQEPQLVQEPLQSSSQQEDQEHSDVPEQKQLESVRDCSGRPRILRSGKTYNALNALETKELILPQTFREATQGEANSYWKEAMAKDSASNEHSPSTEAASKIKSLRAKSPLEQYCQIRKISQWTHRKSFWL